MNDFIKRILIEADIPIEKVFNDHEMNRYAFIWRDTTKFITIDLKRQIVKTMENYRKKSGKGLETIEINPQMLIATQNTIDSDNLSKINKQREKINSIPFVVKLNMVYYLLDGHHRTSIALINKEKLIKVHFMDLNSIEL